MQAHTRSRAGGYSDFFFSGFRAITSRNDDRSSRPSSTYSLPVTAPSSSASPKESPLRHSTDGGEKGRISRMGVRKVGQGSTSDRPVSPDKQRKRSSILEISSKLFDKMIPGASEAKSFVDFDDTRHRLRTPYHHHSRSATTADWSKSVLSTNSHITAIRTQCPDSNELDPFNSSPESKSFFIDLTDSSSIPSPARPKNQSYISFSGSSLSSLTSFTRRERPTSSYSLPAPRSPSRNSTYLSSLDKHDSSPSPEEGVVLDSIYETENGDLSTIDWREFHIHLFNNV
ncbi:hypothetical protein D9757_002403 [Collybiopsis confluens]|uniref:Uncharacterized protein n=1 Tax=Collybiopsis confluens TaxID=2823264 RepID=A0A8H5MEL3_9AGAR|nr:hypothetical protein D9757_002403 [Collybiopsis confluens]